MIHEVLSEDRPVSDAHQADHAAFLSNSNCQDGLAGIPFGNSLIKQVATDLAQELPGVKTFVTLSPVPGLARWLAGRDRHPLPRGQGPRHRTKIDAPKDDAHGQPAL